MDEPDHVHKKASSEILFAEYGQNVEDGEDPTAENKRVIDLMDPVDSMSLNQEKNRVVVSGIRGVLQVIKIRNSAQDLMEGPSIIKDIDMRAYRKNKVNILYSAQNVKWNQIYDQYIATTSSNGSIVCWNVSRRNKSVYKSHERSATCLDWHSNAPYILVSGSRDCSAKSYDLRVKDVHQLTFCDRNCESVRDIAFCKAPGFADYFFTGDDGGVLRLWDLRQTKRWVFENVAHRSFVSTLSLNPNNRMLIASGGGRDKMVKIWEWSGPELKRISVVETTAPLGRVVWRPDKPYQLATCASVNETTVHVWDVRRPFLPYVTYDEHRDSVTDACWPSNDFDVFMSCGKDGLIVLHNIDSGHAPINYACDVAFDITPDGCMGLAVNSEIHAKNYAMLEEKAQASSGKKTVRQIPYETFRRPIKSLIAFGVPESLTHSLPPSTFYQIAEKYLIGGMEIMHLCEANSKVARNAGQEHVAQTWRLVEALCQQAKIQEEYDRLSAEEKARIIKAWVVRKKELAEEGRRWLANLDDFFLDDVKKLVTERLENTQHVTAFLNYSSSSGSEDRSDDDDEDEEEDDEEKEKKLTSGKKGSRKEEKNGKNRKNAKKKKKKKVNFTDFYFGAEESNFKNAGGKKEVLHHNEFMGLKSEAFVLRDEEKESKFFCKARKQPANAEEYEQKLQEIEAGYKAWSPMLEIYRLLHYHAQQGDMQTCATISMVCGKRLFDEVDPYTVNGWIQCYMEMLNSLELFMVCAKIRKYCPLESISSVSRENTTIQLAHADCNAMVVNGRCTKCEKAAESDCTVCRFPIVGMMYQCNICGHSMHTNHAFEWFQKTTECAFVGCPCTCGRNKWPDVERTFVPNDDKTRHHRKYDHSKHEEEPEPIRVEPSRLDTDSESDDASVTSDPEWSATNDHVRQKCGLEVQMDKPWEKYLKDLYTARYKMPEPREKFEESLWTPKALKECGKTGIRGALDYRMQSKEQQLKDDVSQVFTEEQLREVDRYEYTKYYLNPEEKVREELIRKRRARRRVVDDQAERLEQIDEESEDEGNEGGENMVAEEEEENEIEDVNEQQDGWGDDRYGNEYIEAIGPIGLQEWQLERVMSPVRTEEDLEESLRRVRRITIDQSSESLESSDGEILVKEPVKREKSLKERALEALSMSKEQMKRERAKKRRRKEDEIMKIPNGKSYQIFDYSSDEYAISSDTISETSSTPSSTPSSEEDTGYKAENEELEGGTSNEEMKEKEEEDDDVLFKRLQLPTSNNASLPISPPLKIKKFKKLSKSICYSSGGDSDTGNAEKVLIYVDAAYPASASAGSDATCSVTPAPLGDFSGEQVNTDGAPYLEFLQKKKEEQPTVDTDEDLFSTDEEIDRIMESLIEEDSDENDPQPFFPIIEGASPLQLRTNHPWESREQYEERLQKELESAENDTPFEPEKEDSPLLKQLERRLSNKTKTRLFSKPIPELKRARFDQNDHEDAMDVAIKKLKELTNHLPADEPEPEHLREKERCKKCKHEIKYNKMVKEQVGWIRDVAEESQIFWAYSFNDPCAIFQLAHIDTYKTDVLKAKKSAKSLTEFIKIFYFIKWDELMRPNCDFMLKEVYEMWSDFEKQRSLVCRKHFNDFKFKFFASSVATKIKQQLYCHESVSVKQNAIKFDWMFLKPCVNTSDDPAEVLDEMLQTVCGNHPNWTQEERNAASQYWNMFGKVPIHIKSVEKEVLAPYSEERLEILDDTNYWTKKMLKQVMNNKRNTEIKLAYMKRKKRDDVLYKQKDSNSQLSRHWKSRLDSFKNETLNFDAESSFIGYNHRRNILHTDDMKHPWPICQLENETHYITVQPMVTTGYIKFKSRLRHVFDFNRNGKSRKRVPNSQATFDDIRNSKAFKKFEPRLNNLEKLKNGVAKHFKVIDRNEIARRYILYPIVEEEDEVNLIIKMLDNSSKDDKKRLDPEEIFAERRHLRERKEIDFLGKRETSKYRNALANAGKLEMDKMNVFKKHYMPQLRSTIRKARKVVEMGRVLVEEEIQKWMEYQYEMSFVKKTLRKNVNITKKMLEDTVPFKWIDPVKKTNFSEPVVVPPYTRPMPIQRPVTPPTPFDSPLGSPYNSSSEEDEEEAYEERVEKNIEFETVPDLPLVAGILQQKIAEDLSDNDDDEDWKYSDESSVASWFKDDVDDIVNRLVNSDYVDEHVILKERARGALARPLWRVMEDEKEEDPETDDELNDIDEIIDEDYEDELKSKIAWREENGDDRDVGVSFDDRKLRKLRRKEHELDFDRFNGSIQREKEVEQVRYAFKQFALNHSYETAPYKWNPELHEPIALLHRSELRRVANRIHKRMKDDYENIEWQNDAIVDEMPVFIEENTRQLNYLNFLLFRKPGESFKESRKTVKEAQKLIEPLAKYEMFFGKEGVYRLKSIEKNILECRNMKFTIAYLSRQFATPGMKMKMSIEKITRFLKFWWCNSRDSLKNFIGICEEALQTENQIENDLAVWKEVSQNIEIVKDTVDQLEIASLMNEVLFTVEQYVEETELIFSEATCESERIAFGTMDIWDWHAMKFAPEEGNWRVSTPSDAFFSVSSPSPQTSQTGFSSSTTGFGSGSNSKSSESSNSANNQNSPQQTLKHYEEVYNRLKELKDEKQQQRTEKIVKGVLERWEKMEESKRCEVEEKERKVRDFLMIHLAVEEKQFPEKDPPDWNGDTEEMLEKYQQGDYESNSLHVYAREGLHRYDILEMCGLPVTLDHQMFQAEMAECQSAATSVTNADEMASLIEGFDEEEEEETFEIRADDINDDAQSYSSVNHVLEHELYFQRELHERLVPSCVFLFTPSHFFSEVTPFEKWRRVIEASDSPFTFNRLVIRERMLQMARDEFKEKLIEKYFTKHERSLANVLKVFHGFCILVVFDTQMNPWTCRIVSRYDVEPARNRVEYIRELMIRDSQQDLTEWLRIHRIATDVYACCPVIIAREAPLSSNDADKIADLIIDESVRENWFMLRREEGVRALDTMIRMPPPPAHKLSVYKHIFKPIYDEWYPVWKFENDRDRSTTVLKRKYDPVKEYLHKSRMIVNYAHQHYRMKRFDSLMSRDPTEFQLIDRSDVPSASLFDSLDAAVSKFCNEDSPHLNPHDRQMVKDTLIQLATGKIPHFTTNYFDCDDYTEAAEVNNQEEEENDDDRSPLLRITDDLPAASPNAKYLELESCEDEMNWLRALYFDADMHRRRWMAALMFEIAQRAMFRFAPALANFERAQQKFDHLLTLHGKQRPLLDMMLTKIRGTYFMPLETNLFLYDAKLISFGELVDSEIHPKDWKNRRESLRKHRRQKPKQTSQIEEFFERQTADSDSDSASEIRSDPSSSMGSTESLNNSRRGKQARKEVSKAHREMILLKMRSKPANPDITFAKEKRAMGPKRWKTRRRLNETLEGIADLDRFKLELKLPAKKHHLLNYVTQLIVNNSDTAHWSWGDLKMQTRIGRIPPVHRMKSRHISRIKNGKKTYQPPKTPKPDPENSRKWF